MPVKTENIEKKAESYVSGMMKERLPSNLDYHNLSHTREVVEVCKELSQAANLSEEEKELLTIAAWFHDLGFIKAYEGHEEESVSYVREFLDGVNYPDAKIKEVVRLILSTKKEHTPQDLLEEILHDADLAHIGRKRFFRKGELLRIEWEKNLDKTFTEVEWEKYQYQFLVNNKFYTKPAIKEYEKRRAKNIKKQRQHIIKAEKVTVRSNTGKDLGRGIDTLYRANYRNHINLSAIADGKANMMISINTIMISVIVTLSGASLSMSKIFVIEHLRFTVPIFILLIGSLLSVVFAVLSARPKVTAKNIDQGKLEENKISLLYFGNFLGIPRKQFVKYLQDLKTDQERLYDSMSIDLYNLGVVLRTKYKMLTISYNIFMTSLTLTVVAFVVIFIYTNS